MKSLARRRRRSHSPRSRRSPVRLHVEQLEDRRLLYAADLLSAGNYDPKQILVGDLAGQVQKVELPSGTSVGDALTQYASDPLVAYVEPDYVVRTALIPNDPSFVLEYGLNNTGQTISGVVGLADADIDAPEAWDVTTGSTAITVGIIDTGIDYRHPDLYLNVWINQEEIPSAIRANLTDTDSDGLITFWDLNQPINKGAGKITDLDGNGRIDGADLLNNASGWEDGIDQDPYLVTGSTVSRIDDLVGWDFVNNDNNPLDDNNHGTHVAGTIGAIGNNGVGVAGVVWKTQLAAIKFLSSSGSGSISGATSALYYAIANGMEITNNSWAGGGFSQSFANALSAANAVGQIFVAAAGNSGANNDTTASYPSNYNFPNVVAVAATDNRDRLASFSNYGLTTVDLGAPGVNVRSTVPNSGYASFSGTSMATPHVSGAAALVMSEHPDWMYTQVIGALLDTADPLTALAGRVVTGGRLNVNDAVRVEMGDPPPPPPDTAGPRITSATANSFTSASSVRLTFSEAINPDTFDATDVTSFIGPSGTSIEVLGVSPVSGSSGTQFDITFVPQTVVGNYTLVIGPDILDLADNAMDQNGDGTPGDPFQGSFTITAALTYTNNTRYSIRDRSSTYSYLGINQNFSIADVNVRLDITHTYDSDLYIELRHPSGTTVLLVNRRGGSGDNFTSTILDDEAAVAIANGAAPFAGTYRPESSLAALDGKNALGTWRLRVYDAAYQDVGYLNSWSLIITPSVGGASAGGSADRDFRVRALGAGGLGVAPWSSIELAARPRTGRVLATASSTGHQVAAQRPSDNLQALRHRKTTDTAAARPATIVSVPIRPAAHAAACDTLFAELGASSTEMDGSGHLTRLSALSL